MARVKAKSTHKRRSHPDEAKWFPLVCTIPGVTCFTEFPILMTGGPEMLRSSSLSSILIKVSHRRSDSNSRVQERNLRRGQASQFCLRRAEELVSQLREFTESVRRHTGPTGRFERVMHGTFTGFPINRFNAWCLSPIWGLTTTSRTERPLGGAGYRRQPVPSQ